MAHGSFLLCNVAIKIVVFNIFQIVDLAVDHPSISKQHAVLQYRLVNYEREDGTAGRKCK